jgi:hypothetical protein
MNFKLYFESKKEKIETAPQNVLDGLSSQYDEDLKLTKGWLIKNYTDSGDIVVVRCKDLFEDLNNENLMVYSLPNYGFEGYIYPKEPFYKQLMSWELKHKLSSSTKETFGELIDEL